MKHIILSRILECMMRRESNEKIICLFCKIRGRSKKGIPEKKTLN